MQWLGTMPCRQASQTQKDQCVWLRQRCLQMKKSENIFTSALKAVVRLFLRVFYGKKYAQRKAMHEINFLAPKSDLLNERKKHRKSA